MKSLLFVFLIASMGLPVPTHAGVCQLVDTLFYCSFSANEEVHSSHFLSLTFQVFNLNVERNFLKENLFECSNTLTEYTETIDSLQFQVGIPQLSQNFLMSRRTNLLFFRLLSCSLDWPVPLLDCTQRLVLWIPLSRLSLTKFSCNGSLSIP